MSNERFVSRGFVGKRRGGDKKDRIPPGQYLTDDFPVLSAGPTPYTPFNKWTFTIEGLVKEKVSWTWEEFNKLPMQKYVVDISCLLTNPHIGNYGVNSEDEESTRLWLSGLIVREACGTSSNFRSAGELADYLVQHEVPGMRCAPCAGRRQVTALPRRRQRAADVRRRGTELDRDGRPDRPYRRAPRARVALS